MATELITGRVWRSISEEVQSSKLRSHVAVAYFGVGATRLLPLCGASVLVVDASEGAVKSGQTCPRELMKLQAKGVLVYSVANLHAKVFVVGKTAFIGSANASGHSDKTLVEALIKTTDANVVSSARDFVQGLCQFELSPEVLKGLDKIYRPPKFFAGAKSSLTRPTSTRPQLPQLRLAQLRITKWNDKDYELRDRGLPTALKLRKHPRKWLQEEFSHTGKRSYLQGEMVVQVTRFGEKYLVSPPGTILHIQQEKRKNSQRAIIYVERPRRRRKALQVLAAQMGCTEKRLRRGGVVRDADFAGRLLRAWEVI